MVLVVWAEENLDAKDSLLRAMLEIADTWEAPEFLLRGADVIERGVEEGPEVGQLLRAVEDWWIERDFTPDRAALLERLDALVAERSKE